MSDISVNGKLTKKAKNHVSKFFSGFGYFLQEVFILFRQNFKEVMIFLLISSVFTVSLTTFLKGRLIEFMMMVSGETYIAPENIQRVLLNPLSILAMAAFVIVVTLMSLFQIAGLQHAFSMGSVGRNTNITSMIYAGLHVCRKAIHPKNWIIIIFILVLFPLTKLLPLSGSTFKLILPGFVDQTIDYTKGLGALYNAIYFILIVFLTVYIFSVNSFVIQKKSFIQSCRQSRRLIKGHFVETILTMILLTILMNFTINSVSSIIVINYKELMSWIRGNTSIVDKSEAVGTYTYMLRQILKSYLSPAVNNAALTVLFYKYFDGEAKFNTIAKSTFRARKPSKEFLITSMVLLSVLATVSCFFVYQKYSFLAEDVERPLVCAHRGDNVNAPENTMEAFELAASENLQWKELDVHQTSDGVIVCNHDSTIKRVTGYNLAIHEHTFAEVRACKVGNWMPGDYEHVVIPTLEEALTFAKENGLNVQVELKGHSSDVNFEENVLKVINDTGMHDNVMVISQNAARMKRIKELDPNITKGYCMVVALGNLEDLEYSDNITIEETYVTPELVHRMHEQGKKVFCWTVDRDDTVQYLISCGVDVIGTDNPILISKAVDKADYSGGFMRVFHIVMHAIANMDT